MTIKFILLVNKQGQTRLAKYFDESITSEERRALEGEVVRKCLSRTDKQVNGARGGRWSFVLNDLYARGWPDHIGPRMRACMYVRLHASYSPSREAQAHQEACAHV